MPQSAKQGHILVIEPNDITRKLIVGILNNKGYETYEAVTGDEAVTFLAKKPQLVILDVPSGDVGNTGLILKLQAEHSRMPLIVMTEVENIDAVRQRINIPKISVLEKPVMPGTLLGQIEGHLLKGVESEIGAAVAAQMEKKPLPSDMMDPALRMQRETFMRRAIDLSQEKMDENCGGPFGAVIVRDGKIIGEGWNQVTSTNDPTAHAEMTAIRAATKTIGDFRLEGCEIYTSCEPCPMCLAAIYWARIDRIFYGNTREDAERIGFDDDFIYRELAQAEHKRAVPSRLFLREEAKIVFENWMKKKDKVSY